MGDVKRHCVRARIRLPTNERGRTLLVSLHLLSFPDEDTDGTLFPLAFVNSYALTDGCDL